MSKEEEIAKLRDRCWPFGFSIGPGWYDLVLYLDRAIAALVGDYEVHQIKEKFGGLRYYIGGVAWEHPNREDVDLLISVAEAASFSICEECGGTGSQRVIRSWYRTLCDKCTEITEYAMKGL